MVGGGGIEIWDRFAMLRNRFLDFPGAPGLRFASHPFARNDTGGALLGILSVGMTRCAREDCGGESSRFVGLFTGERISL